MNPGFKWKKICAVAAVLALCVAQGHGTGETTIYSYRSLLDRIQRGAEIYLCTVATHATDAEHSNEDRETGQVMLTVDKALYGKPRESLSLPYQFFRPRGPNLLVLHPSVGQPPEWPAFKDGDKILCVTVLKDPGASHYEAVTGVEDVKVRDMEATLALYKLKDAKGGTVEYLATLEKALARPALREFATEAILRAGVDAPEEALKIIHSRVAQYQEGDEPGEIESSEFIDAARTMLYRSEEPAAMKRWLFRCLTAFAQARSVEIRSNVLHTIEVGFGMPGFVAYPLQDALSAEEKEAFRKVVVETKPSRDEGKFVADPARIRKWLDGKKK